MNDILVTGKIHDHILPYGFQTYFFEELQLEAELLGATLWFADPTKQPLEKNIICGHKIINGKWKVVDFKLPKSIYYRYSSPNESDQIISSKFIEYCSKQGCFLANPRPLVQLVDDKWLFHQFLEKHHLADIPTIQASLKTIDEIFAWLQTHKTLYLKPVNASNGRGVSLLSLQKDGYLYNSGETQKILDKPRLLKLINEKKDHIVQPAIISHSFQTTPFDIRVLIQNDGFTYTITGIGIRQGKSGSSISNLKGGGEAKSISHLKDILPETIDIDPLIQNIKSKCKTITTLLDEEYGPFCELAFDVLIDKNYTPVVLEANANPGRWIFTKIADGFRDINDLENEAFYRTIRKETVASPIQFLLNKISET